MKRLLTILLICITTFTLSAQKGKTDQIVKTNGFIIKAKIISTKGDFVTYELPGESFAVQIKKKEVQKVIFNDGKVIEYTKAEQTDDTDSNENETNIDQGNEEEKTPVVIEEVTTTKEDLDSLDWIDVKITENADEVQGLNELGAISGMAEGSKISTPTDVLLSNAIVDLKKEAALRKATIVLVTEIKHNRPYGELPRTIIEAVAFSE